MICRYCKKPLSFLQRMKGHSYCSQDHQRAHEADLERAAIERLQAMKNPQAQGAPEGGAEVQGAQPSQSAPAVPLPDGPPAEASASSPAPAAESRGKAAREPTPRVGAPSPGPPVPAPAVKVAPSAEPPAVPPSPDDADDIPLPSFLTKQRRVAPAKAVPRRLDPAMVGDLDDVRLPPFVTRAAKTGPGPGSRAEVESAGTPESEEIEVPAMVSRRARKARAGQQEPQPRFDRLVLSAPAAPAGWIPDAAICRTPPAPDSCRAQLEYEAFLPGPVRIPALAADVAQFRLSAASPARERAPERAAPSIAAPPEAQSSEAGDQAREDTGRLALLVPVGPDVENLLEASQAKQGQVGFGRAEWLPSLVPAVDAASSPAADGGSPRRFSSQPALPRPAILPPPPAVPSLVLARPVSAKVAAGDTEPHAAGMRCAAKVELGPAEPALAADGAEVPVWLGGAKTPALTEACPEPVAVRAGQPLWHKGRGLDFVARAPHIPRGPEPDSEPWQEWLERLRPAASGPRPTPPGARPRIRKLVSIPLNPRDLPLSPVWEPVGCEFGAPALAKVKQR